MVLAGELDAIVTFATAAGLRQRQWINQVNAAHSALCLGNLQAGWKPFAGELTAHGTLTALDWLAATMLDEGEASIGPEDLKALRADLELLAERVAASAMPRDARAVLTRAIQQMIRTIDDVRIAGVGAIRRQAAEIVADLAAAEPVLNDAGDAPEIGIFAKLFARFCSAAPAIAKFTSWIGTALNTAVTIKQLHDGSPQ